MKYPSSKKIHASEIRNSNRSIGLLLTSQNIGSNSPLVLSLSIVGPIVVLIRFILDYIKENSFEISQVVKTEEIRSIWEREGWSYKEKEKHNEMAFYLRITKKRGIGKLEDCEGIIRIYFHCKA